MSVCFIYIGYLVAPQSINALFFFIKNQNADIYFYAALFENKSNFQIDKEEQTFQLISYEISIHKI